MGLFLFSGAAMANPAPTQTPAPVQPAYTVALTGYNAVPAQTDDNPLVTASGAYSNPEVVAARSQDLAAELPFGTIVEIDGPAAAMSTTCGYGAVAPVVGYRVIADTMNARFSDRVDILFSTKAEYHTAGGMKNASTVLGVCPSSTVRVVGHVDINRIPKTQSALAALVEGRSADLATAAQ